jgi:CBS domain-containing protein
MTALGSNQNDLFNEIQNLRKEISDLKSGTSKVPDGQSNVEDMKSKINHLESSMSKLLAEMEAKSGSQLQQGKGTKIMGDERFAGMEQQTTAPTNQPMQTSSRLGGRKGQQNQQGPQSKMNRPKPLPIEKRKQLLMNRPHTLRDTFMAEPVEEIAFINWKKKRLVLIGEDRLVERALSRINSHNIHSIPVVSESGKGVIGTIDILDIIHALISSIDKGSTNTIQQNMRRDFMNQKVSNLLSKKSYVISNQATLWSAVKHMLEREQDRFVVVNRQIDGDVAQFTQPEMDVDGIFTLSDVLKFLVSNSMLMRKEERFHKSLRELGLGKTEPKTFYYKNIVADAFREIGRLCSDGLAIVDENGVLVGNLSASDLKGVTRNNCPILNNTVEDFLNRDQKRGWWERPFCIDLGDTLFNTVHQFVSTGIHRAYIVDQKGVPVGEVNHRDILNQLWKVLEK